MTNEITASSPASERLYVWSSAEGCFFADRAVNEDAEFKVIAHVPYKTLVLEWSGPADHALITCIFRASNKFITEQLAARGVEAGRGRQRAEPRRAISKKPKRARPKKRYSKG